MSIEPLKGKKMSDEKKIPNNEDMILAELEAYRTGEEKDASKINLEDNQAIEDLGNISKLFSNAKPDESEIPESVDNLILGHIKQKSREIRRERKVVHLSPRYKWAAAAVMGVLVCMVSFKLVYQTQKPANESFKDDTTQILTELSNDTNEKNKLIIQNQEHTKPGLASVESIQEKPKLQREIAEVPVNIVPDEELKTMPASRSPEDIDGNGRVDIIDAYLMDRRLMSGVAMPKKLDLNGDGNINSEDINTIVKTAVSLGKGEV